MTRYAIIDLDRGVLTHRIIERQPRALAGAINTGLRYGSLGEPDLESWPETAAAVQAVRDTHHRPEGASP